MIKLAIVGPPGAGKTTLSRALGSKLKIKVFHMDRLFWHSDWKKETRDNRIDILQKLIQEKQWIIEGTYINSSKLHQNAADTILHLSAADTIIFLNTPPLICLLRIIKRHLVYRGRSRRDIPMGSSDRLTVFSILKALIFPLRGRIKLEKNLRKFSPDKVIRLRSAKEVKIFLANPEQYINKNRQSVKKRSILGQPFILIFGCFLQGLYTSPHTANSYYKKALDIQEQTPGINRLHMTSTYERSSLE